VGIYERDYYRQGGSGFRLRAPRTAVVAIILINVAVFVAELITRPSSQDLGNGPVVNGLACHVDAKDSREDTLTRPWMWWQLLTSGFVHDPWKVDHIIFNLLTLFFLGRDVEEWYGTREFVRLYLVMLVFSSLVWAVSERLFFPQVRSNEFGASGSIAGVVVLFALLFPRRTLMMFFVLPLPAWLVGVLAVGYDIYGATGRTGQHVAYAAHLGGAAFALAYYNFHWNLGNIVRPAVLWIKNRSRPPLKVFKPDDGPDEQLSEDEVDRILKKIHREGESSLTAKERRMMDRAAREYRRRRDAQ
jgi:membrane associated rhomboid family serine protease